MPEYQLQLKQIVDYPRCRIYRQFIQSLTKDQRIRINGSCGLFYFTVLCSYANFRTSYKRIDGISYTVYPGEWICSTKELSLWFRTRFQCQAVEILELLQQRHLITYISLNRGKTIKYKITNWELHNTVLDYNCPCQKDTGFFFIPVSTATELIGAGRCSEMDILLDLWISAIYNDTQVQGSELGPVVYLRNGTGSPVISYNELAARWGISKATVGRILKKLSELDYISLMTFPGKTGSVIYLKNYLSTMFQISDVLIDKEEVAMILNINITLPEKDTEVDSVTEAEHEICVSDELACVSKSQIRIILQKMAKVLDSQGISCFHCPKSRYKLYPLSADWKEKYISTAQEPDSSRIGLIIQSGNSQVCSLGPSNQCDEKDICSLGLSILCGEALAFHFELTLTPIDRQKEREKNNENEQ